MLELKVETFDNVSTVLVTEKILSPNQLLSFVNEVAKIAEENILNFLGKHIRTGQTYYSVRRRLILMSDNQVSIGVGSYTRGFQLRILDKGRKEVYPVRAKKLRFLLYPSQVVIFASHSRAVPASGIMKSSSEIALARSRQIADSTLRTQTYLR
ncbi:MAG: hypothetical protein NWE98_02085 [Candidatus Bathyarchaeota archaeon]|nr:hypothetical protein [Candidatus Bathyarchaeota archaeon]